jgi:hypothetical protein
MEVSFGWERVSSVLPALFKAVVQVGAMAVVGHPGQGARKQHGNNADLEAKIATAAASASGRLDEAALRRIVLVLLLLSGIALIIPR